MVKILSAFRSLFRNDFHYSGTNCSIGIKIPFSNWRLKCSNGRLIRSNECWLDWLTNKSQKFTHEIRNRCRLLVSVSLTLQGIFLNFQEHLLCIYSTLVFKKLFFTVLQQQTAYLRGEVPAINILLSEHKSGQTCQAANSLLLAHEHLPDVNNEPISIPHLEQGYHWNITKFNLKVESWFQ